MKNVVLHPLAQAELLAAAEYYERERAGLGKRFRLAFETASGKMVRRRSSFPLEFSDVRRCPIEGFPYNLFYLDEAESIRVLAVAHHHRRPRYWARRRST